MRLVMYSGGQERGNRRLHQAVVDLTGKSHKISFTYIPFHSDRSEIFFGRTRRRFERFGVSRFFCLNVDMGPSPSEMQKALQSDIIYLAGGNTFYFLNHLRKSGFLNHLKSYARSNGVLAGLSAGAMIFTPTIQLAGHPKLDPDENEEKLKNMHGLGLVKFEFAPHFDGTKKTTKTLLEYSQKNQNPILACSDGAGVVIESKSINPVGQAYLFSRGKMSLLDKA